MLNDRVGVASYPDPDWKDPEVMRGHADEFWRRLEAIV